MVKNHSAAGSLQRVGHTTGSNPDRYENGGGGGHYTHHDKHNNANQQHHVRSHYGGGYGNRGHPRKGGRHYEGGQRYQQHYPPPPAHLSPPPPVTSSVRRHHDSSGNNSKVSCEEIMDMKVGASPDNGSTPTTPSPVPPQPPLNIVWQGLPPNYQIAPDQLFVLSGPMPSGEASDNYVLTAHPVPRGATVLATPAVMAPALPNGGEITIRLNGGQEESSTGTNPNAPPFYPSVHTASESSSKNSCSSSSCSSGEEETLSQPSSHRDVAMTDLEVQQQHKRPRQPSVRVWNSFFPGGKEFPLRQPHPPVYFSPVPPPPPMMQPPPPPFVGGPQYPVMPTPPHSPVMTSHPEHTMHNGDSSAAVASSVVAQQV